MDGDAGLQKLVKELRGFEGAKALTALTHAVAAETISLIKNCFDDSRSPYKEPYAPLVARAGIPLRDSGRLKNAFQDASRPGKVEIHNPSKYARLQNDGSAGLPGGKVKPKNAKALHFKAFGVDIFSQGVTIPSRRFLPDDRGLPADWAKKLEAVARKSLAAHGLKEPGNG